MCNEVVVELQAKYDWQLLSADEFGRIILGRARLEDVQAKGGIKNIAKNVYALILYEACHTEDNPQSQRRAYLELSHYLYNIAQSKRPDAPQDAQDATQLAVQRIAQAISKDEIREPGAFLAVGINWLRAAWTTIDRQRRIGDQEPDSWEEITEERVEDDTATDWEPILAEESLVVIDKTIELRQLAWELAAEIRRKFQIHPRAMRQLQAVLLRLAFNYSLEEIAEMLGVDNNNAVAAVVARGKKKLKNNQELQELYQKYFDQETNKTDGEDQV